MSGRRLTRLLVPLVLLATAGAALSTPAHEPDQELRIASATTLVHANSRGGHAILEARHLAPGERRAGDVTLTNGGTDAHLMLVASRPYGALTERLVLTIREGSLLIGRAPLAEIETCQSLGTFPRGAKRTLTFEVEFQRGRDDNAFANSSAALDLEWVAAANGECPVRNEEQVAMPTTPSVELEVTGHTVAIAGMKVRIEPGPYRFSRKTGTARVGVRCLASDTKSCAGTLRLDRRRAGQGRGIAMASGQIRIPVGRKRMVTLKLNTRARKRVTSTGRVPVRAYVTARDARGRRQQATYMDRLVYGRSSKTRSR